MGIQVQPICCGGGGPGRVWRTQSSSPGNIWQAGFDRGPSMGMLQEPDVVGDYNGKNVRNGLDGSPDGYLYHFSGPGDTTRLHRDTGNTLGNGTYSGDSFGVTSIVGASWDRYRNAMHVVSWNVGTFPSFTPTTFLMRMDLSAWPSVVGTKIWQSSEQWKIGGLRQLPCDVAFDPDGGLYLVVRYDPTPSSPSFDGNLRQGIHKLNYLTGAIISSAEFDFRLWYIGTVGGLSAQATAASFDTEGRLVTIAPTLTQPDESGGNVRAYCREVSPSSGATLFYTGTPIWSELSPNTFRGPYYRLSMGLWDE